MADDAVSPEIIEAIEAMRKGATLLKAGRIGKPHFRQFQISADLKKLEWASPNKKMGESTVAIKDVKELRTGQKTKVFTSNPIKEHEATSFSLIYGDRSLDVVCKDRKEYETWTIGLNALLGGKVTEAVMNSIEASIAAANSDQSENLAVEFKGRTTVVVKREDASDLYTWGEAGRGKLGHGDTEDKLLPQVLEALLGKDVRGIACGLQHTAALSPTGEVYTWGTGSSGRLGHGHERDRVTPQLVAGIREKRVIQISCGHAHTAAVTDNGELWIWGKGSSGQLGFESTKQLSPAQVQGIPQVTSVSCGATATAAITENGELFTWGGNEHGHLGHGDEEACAQPRKVAAFSEQTLVQVAIGTSHMVARTESGEVFTWGEGGNGRLGHNDELDRLTPTLVAALAEVQVTSVAAGADHTACVRLDGVCYTWGQGSHGQLGLGPALQSRSTPTPVPQLDGKPAAFVVAGNAFTAVLTVKGQIYSWGQNVKGRLGHGDHTVRNVPTIVESMADKKARLIAAGGMHMAATVIHGWVPDDEVPACMACKAPFNFVRRRHHCRNCGGVFCGSCSSKKYTLLKAGFAEAVRVCDKCHTILSNKA